MRMKPYEDRDLKVIQWRKEKVSQGEMAKRLGVTRQRVQQIERRLGLGPRRYQGTHKEYPFECSICHKKSRSKIAGRKFCSRECFFNSRHVIRSSQDEQRILETRRQRGRVRSKHYYHNVFKKKIRNWRDVVKKRNKKYSSFLRVEMI